MNVVSGWGQGVTRWVGVSRWVGLAGGDHECGKWAGQGVE